MSFYTKYDIKSSYSFLFLGTEYSLKINSLIGTFYKKYDTMFSYQHQFKDQKELDLFLESLEIAGKIINL